MLCYAFAFLETGWFSLQLYNTIPAGSIIFADLKNDFFLVSHSILYLISLFRRSLFQIICRHNCWICRLTISLEWMLPLLRFWAERTSMICIFMCWLILQVLLDLTTGYVVQLAWTGYRIYMNWSILPSYLWTIGKWGCIKASNSFFGIVTLSLV